MIQTMGKVFTKNNLLSKLFKSSQIKNYLGGGGGNKETPLTLPKADAEITNKHLRRCSTTGVFRVKQIKTTMRSINQNVQIPEH